MLPGSAQRLNPVVRRWRTRLQPVYVAGRRVFVLDEGAGPAILLIHGIPTHSYLWRDVAERLQSRYRVVAPDLLGFGFSDKPTRADISPAGQANLLLAVLDSLGVDEFGLVVHDYGALVGCELLSRIGDRIRFAVITNTSLWREDWRGSSLLSPLKLLTVPLAGEAALTMAMPFMLKQAFSIYVDKRSRLTDETMALYWHPFEIGFATTLLQLFRSTPLDEADFERWQVALCGFRRPSQVIWGLHDPTFRRDRGEHIAGLLPNGNFVGLRHSNHFVPEDRPLVLGRLVTRFAE